MESYKDITSDKTIIFEWLQKISFETELYNSLFQLNQYFNENENERNPLEIVEPVQRIQVQLNNFCKDSTKLDNSFFLDFHFSNLMIQLFEVQNVDVLSNTIKIWKSIFNLFEDDFLSIFPIQKLLKTLKNLFSLDHIELIKPILNFYSCFCDQSADRTKILLSAPPGEEDPYFSVFILKDLSLSSPPEDYEMFDLIFRLLYSLTAFVPNLYNAQIFILIIRIIWHRQLPHLYNDWGIWALGTLLEYHSDKIAPSIYTPEIFFSEEENLDSRIFFEPSLSEHIQSLLENIGDTQYEYFNIRGAVFLLDVHFFQ